ncbi:MAG: nitroreductase family protein [Anaerolineae bacterium]|nr:nitroreductase family protein [Anaerolineae bacterium]
METFEALTRRHGVLRYRPDPVEPEKIERVLRAAIAAPSPANTQPWAFVVVTEPELARRVAAELVRMQKEHVFCRLLEVPEPFVDHLMHLYDDFANVPCFIVVCRQRRADWAGEEHAALVRDWELCSLGAAMANLMAAAADLGLGTRWFGNPMADGGVSLKRLLGIPEEVEVVAVTPLGTHDEPPKERPVQSVDVHAGFQRGDKHKLAALLQGKLALEDVVHTNRYG